MTSQAVEHAPHTNAVLAIQANQKYWTADQKATLKGIGLSGTDAELQALLHIAQVHQLDPAAGQMTPTPSSGTTQVGRFSEQLWGGSPERDQHAPNGREVRISPHRIASGSSS